jgi:hypothetical protein
MRRALGPVCLLLLLAQLAFGKPAGGVWPGTAAAGTPAPDMYLPLVTRLGGPSIAGCPLFPADNILNRRVDSLPVHSRSNAWISSMKGSTTGLHPDFGANWDGGPFGIPYTTVPGSQPKVAVSFYYSDSDPGPYPIPPDAPVEGDGVGDSHVLVLDRDACKLYELFAAKKNADSSWYASSGAIFDLRSNALRPLGWTSADAAGLSILAGLVRYDEVQSGAIRHAIRFTAAHTQEAYLWPARHEAGDTTSADVPPMGARFRLKASKDISAFSDPKIQVIFKAFKEYGLILADNGSNWYISGTPDANWDDEVLVDAFKLLKGSDFEAVDVSGLMVNPDSGQSK